MANRIGAAFLESFVLALALTCVSRRTSFRSHDIPALRKRTASLRTACLGEQLRIRKSIVDIVMASQGG